MGLTQNLVLWNMLGRKNFSYTGTPGSLTGSGDYTDKDY